MITSTRIAVEHGGFRNATLSLKFSRRSLVSHALEAPAAPGYIRQLSTDPPQGCATSEHAGLHAIASNAASTLIHRVGATTTQLPLR